MNAKEAIITALKEYRAITGLRSYLIEDEDDINSAAEKNYFCKCLKTSAAALRHCEECTSENYRNALQSDKVCMYSCHAGPGQMVHADPLQCVQRCGDQRGRHHEAAGQGRGDLGALFERAL